MPVAQSQGHAGKALAIAALAIGLIAMVAVFVALAASRGDVEINLGDDRFNAGRAERLAKEIGDGGGLPFLYPDLVGKDRNLFVQHLGDDPEKGWVAFGAFDPDDPSCSVLIDRKDKTLVNGCDESVTYPLGGEGLRQYPTTVEDGEIYVDVNELTTSTVGRGSGYPDARARARPRAEAPR
jgi:hypothetical protein